MKGYPEKLMKTKGGEEGNKGYPEMFMETNKLWAVSQEVIENNINH
jgi:hypothetical protein